MPYLTQFEGPQAPSPPAVQCVLVDLEHPDSPDVGQADDYLIWRVPSLLAFADKLLGPRPAGA